MHRSKGFTLLELMVALLVSVILFVACFSVFGRFQILASNLNLILERDENLWLAPLLFSRWISTAGNNRWTQSWEGLSIGDEEMAVNSDLDGPDGFPDSQLDSRFEAVVLRRNGSTLQLKSGPGSFQPVLKNISQFQVHDQNLPLLTVQISAVTERPLWFFRRHLSESTILKFYLWNYRPNLFAEVP